MGNTIDNLSDCTSESDDSQVIAKLSSNEEQCKYEHRLGLVSRLLRAMD
jgi:hypothetical protein